jgi:hypothetical protein
MSSWNEDIAVLNSLFEAHLAPLMKDFREWGCAVSPTFRFWDMFLLAANTTVNLAIFNDGLFCGHVTPHSVEGTSFLSNSKETCLEA